jgi:hypothetical protein
LQKRGVGAAIVGARHVRHLSETLRLSSFVLSETDLSAIGKITGQSKGPVGDIYGLERIKGGKHAAIMKYDLGKAGAQ